MNEQACAFVCAMFCVFGAVLAGYWIATNSASPAWIVSGIGLIVFLISGFVIACRFT